jgi:trans-AT polyketide synthase, acyltransferase and oxidoreductase domains
MNGRDNGLQAAAGAPGEGPAWVGPPGSIAFDKPRIRARLLDLERPAYALCQDDGGIGISCEGHPGTCPGDGPRICATVPPTPPGNLGDPDFRRGHGVSLACVAGAMANGIACEELVIALGRAGLLGSFGAAGLLPARLETAIRSIQAALPEGPCCFNLIHSPSEEALESGTVALYLRHGVTTVEASAYLDLTPHIVLYRAAGLTLDPGGQIHARNRVLAKISRPETAAKFLQPAPVELLRPLVASRQISALQASLAERVPMADDLTVEADSGGHTDNRPLVCLLPQILALRDEIQEMRRYPRPVRIGAAGGISTPASALAAFMMGAAYVVTGSVNQSCLEAATSRHTKQLLAAADVADVMMAPAADMFEMGVKVQVLKRGSLFPMRANKLLELYRSHDSIDEIPAADRAKLEAQVFRKPLESVWDDTVAYFSERDPEQIRRAENNPKRKMALIFRWYLGLSSRWSIAGESSRQWDYQVWCGPSMGAFNRWVRGSYLEAPERRSAVDVARHILQGAAFLYRLQSLRLQGLCVSQDYNRYRPSPLERGDA